jgi:ribosomal-protein-alanine N-acetyltransferase
MYYLVERMEDADIEAVQEVERQSFTTPWSANTYRQEIRNQVSRYIVARASPTLPPPRNRIVPVRRNFLERWLALFFPPVQVALPPDPYPIIGYGGVALYVDEGHITTIAIAPEYRGQGIGELLLNGLIDHGVDLGAERLTLEVRISNTIAQQLYLKYGFEPVGKRKRYYTDNGEDAMLMTTPPIRAQLYQDQLKPLRDKLYERLRRAAEAPPSEQPQRPEVQGPRSVGM